MTFVSTLYISNGFERCILCISGRSELFYEKDFKHPFEMAGRFAVGPWDIHSYVFGCKHATCRGIRAYFKNQCYKITYSPCSFIKSFLLSLVSTINNLDAFKIFITHLKLFLPLKIWIYIHLQIIRLNIHIFIQILFNSKSISLITFHTYNYYHSNFKISRYFKVFHNIDLYWVIYLF